MIFVFLLKMPIIPLIFSTLVFGVSSIAELKKLGRVADKTIIYYLAKLPQLLLGEFRYYR